MVGIAGPSCSGKTVLAGALARRLDGLVVPLDAYYRDLAHLEPALRDARNFDHPDALDRELLTRQLRELAAGRPVEQPVYDFKSHSRQPSGRRAEPRGVVIVEGLFSLHFHEVRELLDLGVYVDLEDAPCLERRLARDTRERGRDAESVRDQYARTVRPMCRRFVEPTRDLAGLVVRGDLPLPALVDAVVARLG